MKVGVRKCLHKRALRVGLFEAEFDASCCPVRRGRWSSIDFTYENKRGEGRRRMVSVSAVRREEPNVRDTSLESMCAFRNDSVTEKQFLNVMNIIKEQMRCDHLTAFQLGFIEDCVYRCSVQIKPIGNGIRSVIRSDVHGVHTFGDLIPKHIIEDYNNDHPIVLDIQKALGAANIWPFEVQLSPTIKCQTSSSDGVNVLVRLTWKPSPTKPSSSS